MTDELVPVAGTKQELVLIGHLTARPDLIGPAAINPKYLGSQTARAMLKVLMTQDPEVYSKPGPMYAALDDLPQDIDAEEAEAAFVLAPEPSETDLKTILGLKAVVKKQHDDRVFIQRIDGVMRELMATSNADDAADKLRRYLTEFKVDAGINRDHTGKGILERVRQAPPKIRWKCGIEDLDIKFQGIGPDGQPGYGMLAQKEVVVLAAGYKAGKTRESLNWVISLLDQGASVAMLVLEDDEGSFATKIMGAKARVPKYLIERYLVGGVGFLGAGGREIAGRIEEAVRWWEEHQLNIRIYDAATQATIFDFKQALEVLAIDKLMYNTTHVVVDYVQQWGGEYKEMAGYAFALRAFAAQHDVCMVEISQFSNQTIQFGSASGQLAAKGAGEWGQTCHAGLELVADPHGENRELCLMLKVSRDAEPGYVFVEYDKTTGTRTRYYGTPESEGFIAQMSEKGKPKGGRKK